jgi:uncharacterized protein with PIN domain
MMVDTPASADIACGEPERARFDRLVDTDPVRLISAAARIEACLAAEDRKHMLERHPPDRFRRSTQTDIAPAAR